MTFRRKKPWSGLVVGSVREEFRSRSGIALVDQDLRPSRKHERKGAARIVGSDRCLDPCRSEQTLNDLRLVPRPIGADCDQPAHFRRDNRSLSGGVTRACFRLPRVLARGRLAWRS